MNKIAVAIAILLPVSLTITGQATIGIKIFSADNEAGAGTPNRSWTASDIEGI